MAAAKTSLIVAFLASISSVVLGGLASYGLSRSAFRGRDLLLAQFIAPMIVPTIITAIALFFVFSQVGLLGTYTGLILAHTIVVVPFVVLIVFPVFDSFDRRLELAARSLGASWMTTTFQVFLPNVFPSIVGAWFFAFIMSFDELLVALFISGRYFTLPKKIYNELILQINPVITAISTILVVFTALVMLLVAWLMSRGETKEKGIGGFLGTEEGRSEMD